MESNANKSRSLRRIFSTVVIYSSLLLCVGRTLAAPFAYISNFADASVSVIDLADNLVKATIAVQPSPIGVAVNPAGTRVYVANRESSSVSVISTATNTVITTINLGPGRGPEGVAVNSQGTFAYVGNRASRTVSIIDTGNNTVVKEVGVGATPGEVVVNPAGTRVYVANQASNDVSVIETVTNTELTRIPTQGTTPTGIAINASGTTIYVANANSDSLSVIDASTNRVSRVIAVGVGPEGVAIHPQGNTVYVANTGSHTGIFSSGSVSVVDVSSSSVVAQISTGLGSTGLAVNSAGTKLYVANAGSDSVSVIDTTSKTVIASVGVGRQPYALGSFITNSDGSPPGVLSGMWWNPNESGWGINLTERRNTIFAAWYTYDSSGNAKWYVGSNCSLSGSVCTSDVLEVNGPRFFGTSFTPPTSSMISQAGTMRLAFQDNNSASMSYTVNGVTRTVNIVRQIFRTQTVAPPINYTDLWWNPSESGWGLAVTQQADNIFLAWYVYDNTGKPTWYVASNCAISGAGCSGTLYRTLGPAFGTSFDPAQVRVFAVGSISLSFSDPNNGALNYVVDGVPGSKSITRQIF